MKGLKNTTSNQKLEALGRRRARLREVLVSIAELQLGRPDEGSYVCHSALLQRSESLIDLTDIDIGGPALEQL